MLIIAIIMSGLALLAATVCLILSIQEKKRNQKRNTALCNLLRAEFDQVIACIGEFKVNSRNDFAETFGKLDGIALKLDHIVLAFGKRIDDLEKGISPDYNEALAAKQAVDDFNMGISAILNFDPMESLQRERQKAQLGGEEI